jgi:hypothetical protein
MPEEAPVTKIVLSAKENGLFIYCLLCSKSYTQTPKESLPEL